jgi:hypothetical protein
MQEFYYLKFHEIKSEKVLQMKICKKWLKTSETQEETEMNEEL